MRRQSKTEVQGEMWRELRRHWHDDACDRGSDMMKGLKLCLSQLNCDHLLLDEGIAVMQRRIDEVVVAAHFMTEAEWYALPQNQLRRLQVGLR